MYNEKSELINFVKHRFKGIGNFYDNLWDYDSDSEELTDRTCYENYQEIADFVGAEDYKNGASKLVLFFNEFPQYIIKIPLFGCAEVDYDDYLDEDVTVSPDNLDYIEYGKNYCEEEAYIYKKAKAKGIEEFFAKTEFLTTIEGIDIYYSKKVVRASKYELQREKLDEAKSLRDCYEVDLASSYIAQMLVYASVDKIKVLLSFICEHSIWDLIGDNVFIDKDGHVQLVDYSSFDE
jgi:hypothetical protein